MDTDENSAMIPCPISKKVRSPKIFGKANFKPTKESMWTRLENTQPAKTQAKKKGTWKGSSIPV